MQAIIEFVAGLVAMLAAAALAHLGVDLEPRRAESPREIHRTADCPDEPAASVAPNQDC